MTRLSRSFVRERELIIVDAEVVGPASATKARLVLDTGAAIQFGISDLFDQFGY
jgi:hypothetical protein